MPINAKKDFNSTIFASHPVTTSSHPSHRPVLKNRQYKIIAASRIIFGLIWVVAARLKWQPEFQNHFLDQVSGAIDGQPGLIAGWISVWIHLISINPLLFARIEATAETTLAICLVLGVFSNLTYLIGFLLSLGIWSTAEGFGGPFVPGQSTDIGTAFPYALVFVIMFSFSAGRYYGLDQWLTPQLGRWGFLASGFFKPKRGKRWSIAACLQWLQNQPQKVTAASRIAFGLIWAVAAWLKWQPAFQNHFLDQVSGATDGQPGFIVAWLSVWIHLISINPLLFARIEATAETALAVCLVLGVFSNLTYLIGFLLSLGIWSTAEGFGGPYVPGQSTDIGTAFPYALLFVIMFAISAGCYYGLDKWLTPLLGRRGFLATGSFKRKQRTDELTNPFLQHVPSTRKLQLEPDYPFTTQNLDYLPDLSYQQDEDEFAQTLYHQAFSQQPLEPEDLDLFSTPNSDFLLEHYDEQDRR